MFLSWGTSLQFWTVYHQLHHFLAPLLSPLVQLVRFWSWRKLIWSHWVHPSFCMSQAIRKDQVCPSSNKGGCLIPHPLLAIYIRDLICLTAHLRPPLLIGLVRAGCPVVSEPQLEWRQWYCHTIWWWKLWVCSLSKFLMFLSRQTSFERAINLASTNIIVCWILYIVKNGSGFKHPSF